MLTALRAEVNALLEQTPVKRKPALRRSDAPHALLATDLPFAAEREAMDAFVIRAESAGWRVFAAPNGWLLMDKEVPVPACDLPANAEGPCGCCLSLLARHHEGGEADVMIRQVVRAQEAGWREFDRLCERLHADFAQRLRCHQPLPGALLPYMAYAWQTLSDRRK